MKYLSLTESELTHFHFDTPIHTYVRIVLHEAIYIYICITELYISGIRQCPNWNLD